MTHLWWCAIIFWISGWIGSFLIARPATYGIRTALLLVWLAFLWPLAVGIWIAVGAKDTL